MEELVREVVALRGVGHRDRRSSRRPDTSPRSWSRRPWSDRSAGRCRPASSRCSAARRRWSRAAGACTSQLRHVLEVGVDAHQRRHLERGRHARRQRRPRAEQDVADGDRVASACRTGWRRSASASGCRSRPPAASRSGRCRSCSKDSRTIRRRCRRCRRCRARPPRRRCPCCRRSPSRRRSPAPAGRAAGAGAAAGRRCAAGAGAARPDAAPAAPGRPRAAGSLAPPRPVRAARCRPTAGPGRGAPPLPVVPLPPVPVVPAPESLLAQPRLAAR